MSQYHYAQPMATHQYSDNTKRHGKMAGVMSPTKRCTGCGKHKPLPGSRVIARKFYCAACSCGEVK